MRNIGCPDCAAITSGDCGKHGPMFIQTGFSPMSMASGGYVPSELDLLRAQVAALQKENQELRELTQDRLSPAVVEALTQENAYLRLAAQECVLAMNGEVVDFDGCTDPWANAIHDLQRERENCLCASAAREAFADVKDELETVRAEREALITAVGQIRSELLEKAKECSAAAGVPCQCEYRWHADDYERWAARLATLGAHRETP